MISLCFGIKDEAHYLPYLASFLKKNQERYDEAVFSVEESTTDNSFILCSKMPKTRVLIHRKEECNDVRAANYNYCLNHSFGDRLFVLAPDLWLDPGILQTPRIFDTYEKLTGEHFDVVTFRYWNHGLGLSFLGRMREEWDNVLKKMLDLTPRRGSQRSGLMAIRRDAWEKVGGFVDSANFEELFLLHSGLAHYHNTYSKILHLRTGYSKNKQILQGVARRQSGFPLWRVFGHSVLHFKPYVLVAYLQD
jgi:hypothetical protein